MPEAGKLKATPAAELLQMLRSSLSPDGGPIDAAGLFRVLNIWEQEKAAAEVATEVRRIQHEQAQDVNFKLIALMMEKGAAYTNLVILAGYAAFFALMPLVKDLITVGERKGAVLLMLISIATFVGFEIYKMIVMQFAVVGRLAEYNNAMNKPDFDLIDAAAELQRDMNQKQVMNLYIWKFSITVAVLSGLFALAILALALITNPAPV
jgi:hypothetical protein